MIARVLITQDCQRNCENCCNKQPSILNKAEIIYSIEEVLHHEIICLTGGEPMLYPDKLIRIINTIRSHPTKHTIYLYTAYFTWRMNEIIPLIDGIHYTLHKETLPIDIEKFHQFQTMIWSACETKSFRLYIQPGMTHSVKIHPWKWKRIELKPWLEDCPLPSEETLYILKGGVT